MNLSARKREYYLIKYTFELQASYRGDSLQKHVGIVLDYEKKDNEIQHWQKCFQLLKIMMLEVN